MEPPRSLHVEAQNMNSLPDEHQRAESILTSGHIAIGEANQHNDARNAGQLLVLL